MQMIPLLVVIVSSLFSQAMAQQGGSYQVLETLPHDASYFTQGLEVSGGLMFESAGLYGKSRLRKYRVSSDATLLEKRIPDDYFAEGLTLINDELFLLTWKKGKVFVFNPEDLALKKEYSYQTEGWGLANDGKQLIMSDGSDTIYFRDPATFDVVREIRVSSQQQPIQRINELEFAGGYLWANIWGSPVIVKIDPRNGALVNYYDLTEIVRLHTSGTDDRVLNGIAYDAGEQAFWVTGKLWDKRYLIRFDKN